MTHETGHNGPIIRGRTYCDEPKTFDPYTDCCTERPMLYQRAHAVDSPGRVPVLKESIASLLLSMRAKSMAEAWEAFPLLRINPRSFHGLKPTLCECYPTPSSAALVVVVPCNIFASGEQTSCLGEKHVGRAPRPPPWIHMPGQGSHNERVVSQTETMPEALPGRPQVQGVGARRGDFSAHGHATLASRLCATRIRLQIGQRTRAVSNACWRHRG